jgi:hypothetical protein
MRSFIISTSCAIQPSVQQSGNFLKHFERYLIIIKKSQKRKKKEKKKEKRKKVNTIR